MFQENDAVRERRRKSNGFFFGVMLIVVGAIFLLERTRLIPEVYLVGWWPVVLLALGFARLLRPAHAGHVGSGVTLLLLGTWCLAVVNEWLGLTWHNSWPLALVASGAGMVTRAIAARFMPDRWEVRRDA